MSGIAVRQLDAYVFRWPVSSPVETSFGAMRDRPAVFVRLEDSDGCHGWGEAWCNFPSVGAEYRARLVKNVLAPIMTGRQFETPRHLFDHLTSATEILALQTGERGPFAQAIAAIDIAAWDIVARRAGQPLWRLLGGDSGEIRVYASGINPTEPARTARAMQAKGHSTFKLKVGFGAARDRANLLEIRSAIGDAVLAVDANQAWQVKEAKDMLTVLEPFCLAWIEEPLRCDRPWHEWQELTRSGSPHLAAGENLIGEAEFAAALATKILRIVQPDVTKWGGFSGCLPVARAILESGSRFCPHFLGAGIGLVASAHLLAGAGGDGLLEIDSNDNPLREIFAAPQIAIINGRVQLSDHPGLGIEPDLKAIVDFCVPL